MGTMTARLAAATAERVEAAAFVAGECAVHGTAEEAAMFAEAVIHLARAEKLLRKLAEGRTAYLAKTAEVFEMFAGKEAA